MVNEGPPITIIPERRDNTALIVVGGGIAVVGVAIAWKMGWLDELWAWLGGKEPPVVCPPPLIWNPATQACESPPPNGPPPEPPENTFSWQIVVTDTELNRLPDADVLLTNRETMIAYKLVTDANGEVFFTGIPTGNYDLDVIKPGFQSFHQPFINRTEAKVYTPKHVRLLPPQTRLETLQLTKANAAGLEVSDGSGASAGCYDVFVWDLVGMLRAQGHSVPTGEVDVSTPSGTVRVGNGWFGWLFNKLYLSLYYDQDSSKSAFWGQVGQGSCDPTDPAHDRNVAGSGWQGVNLLTLEGLWGEFSECNIQLLVTWEE